MDNVADSLCCLEYGGSEAYRPSRYPECLCSHIERVCVWRRSRPGQSKVGRKQVELPASGSGAGDDIGHLHR